MQRTHWRLRESVNEAIVHPRQGHSSREGTTMFEVEQFDEAEDADMQWEIIAIEPVIRL